MSGGHSMSMDVEVCFSMRREENVVETSPDDRGNGESVARGFCVLDPVVVGPANCPGAEYEV